MGYSSSVLRPSRDLLKDQLVKALALIFCVLPSIRLSLEHKWGALNMVELGAEGTWVRGLLEQSCHTSLSLCVRKTRLTCVPVTSWPSAKSNTS